jgi:hypothetical protein
MQIKANNYRNEVLTATEIKQRKNSSKKKIKSICRRNCCKKNKSGRTQIAHPKLGPGRPEVEVE